MRLEVKRTFSAGHRLMMHRGKCLAYHGHNWSVYISVQGPVMEASGMLMDFSVFKHVCDNTLEKYDHAFLVNAKDRVLLRFLKRVKSKHVVMAGEPTCENLVRRIVQELKDHGLAHYTPHVRIYETEGCCASDG